MSRANHKRDLGVTWHLPAPGGGYRKRAFATTTQASSDLVALLAASGITWAELRDELNYDLDARDVAQGFIDAGYADVRADEHVFIPDHYSRNI